MKWFDLYRSNAHWRNAEAVVQRCSVKNAFLKILQNSQGNTRARVSFLKKNTCARVSLVKIQAENCNFIKKKPWHRCIPMNFVKFWGTSSFIEHLWWLLLHKEMSGRPDNAILIGTVKCRTTRSRRFERWTLSS